MVVVRAMTLTKAKETIMFSQCHSFTLVSLKMFNFKLTYKTKQKHPWDGKKLAVAAVE